MPVQHCPYCQAPLQIPRKRLEHPIDCPRCGRTFLAAPGGLVAPGGHAPSAAPPLPDPHEDMARAVSLADRAARGHAVQAPVRSQHSPEVSSQAATQSAEASTTVRILRQKLSAPILQPTVEGKLPELQLTETTAPRRTPDFKAIQSNPVFMALLFALSLGASAVLLLTDFDPYRTDPERQAEARQRVQAFSASRTGAPLQPYQMELRHAQQAHSRGDYAAERAYYRKVMDRLLAEDRNPYIGVTGSPTADRELQSYLSLLLGEETPSAFR